MRNNSYYRNLSGLELKFELKFKEMSMSQNQRKIDWKILET
jgi:hypothetical protein